MKINIRGEKQEITEAMKVYTEEKLSKLEKYLEKVEEVKCNVVFKLEGPLHRVEITIPLKEVTLRVEEKAIDYYAAIDIAIDKLERQIRKSKTKLENRKQGIGAYFTIDDIEETEEEKEKIVKRKKIDVKPMDEEEAILQLELIGHDFFLYKDIDIDNYAVVYKRKNGGYGKIEVE